jgi:RecA-family ATPase
MGPEADAAWRQNREREKSFAKISREWDEMMQSAQGRDREEAVPKAEPFSVADFEGKPVPAREWNVEDHFPHRVPALLSGDGAAGKTTLALQLGVAKAAGLNWLGLETRPGRTLFVNAEDDKDELHRRVDYIRAEMQLTWEDISDLALWPLAGEADAVMGAFYRRRQLVIPTKTFELLEERVCDLTIDTVILDTLSDVFAGDENDRQQARQFIGLMRGICQRANCSLLALAHPSLSGMSSGTGISGSTGWNNAVRARDYLYSPKNDEDHDQRVLQVMKANYGPKGLAVNLRWQRGVYVPITENNLKVSPEAADECFLMLLDRYIAQGRHVSPSPSASYAPSIFANDKLGAAFTKAHLRDAMNRLMHAGKIRVETVGPPSRQVKRIVGV